MPPDMAAFLNALFGRCQTGHITLSAIHPDGWHSTLSRHIPVRDHAALENAMDALCIANLRGWGSYVAIATRRANLGRYRRGSRSDLAELPAFYCDVDNKPDFMLRLHQFCLPASCLVQTSKRSYHAYWWLEEPTQDFDLADRLLVALAQHFQGDRLTVVQSMRLAQTENTKPSRNFLCHLVELHPERRYTLDNFRPYLNKLPIIAKQTHSISVNTSQNLNPRLVQAVTDCLIQHHDAVQRPNGWFAACCPLSHERDRRGSHFFYVESESKSIRRNMLAHNFCGGWKCEISDQIATNFRIKATN